MGRASVGHLGRIRASVWLTAGAAVLAAGVITAILGWSLWPFGNHQQAGPQARQFLNVTACLLTGSSGISLGTPGAPAWQAMQSASLATHVMVSYLPVTGPATPSLMLSTLMERNCGVIITTGAPAADVVKAARSDRHQEFVLVSAPGATGARGVPNLVVVSPAGAAARIDQAIRALAAHAQPS